MTTSRCLIVLWIACLSAISVQSLDLASSQYPFYKANRERNNQLTGKILCSSIAPGRTTVFNDTWSNVDLYADILPPMVGQDHFFLLMQDSEGNPFIRRYEIDGASNLAGEYPSRAIPTILQDGSVALSNTTHSVVVSADLTTELFTPLNNLDSLTRYTSMIPVQGSYLLRPYDSADSGFISVLNLTNNIANAYWAANITCSGTIFLTMVYTPASGEDVLVVAADTTSGVKICAGSSTYTIPESVINPWAPPFIADSALHLFLQNNSLVSFNLDTRTFTRTLDYGMGGFYNMQTSMMIRGSKALASLLGETVSNIIDVFSNQTILPKMKFVSHPTFSIPDNVVVIATDNFKGTLQLMALDWDTWEMKATGYFNTPNPGSVSEAVFDENCNMFVTTGDAKAHKLVPMPIVEIVPVIDCIDEFNRAYLTYQNNAQGVARMPYVVDRNALSPDNIAPVTIFNNGSGPHFPFSTRVQLQNASATYQWRLEDYLLTFSVTPQLACPVNVSLTLTFTATSFFDEATFVPLVVNTFISVTGVRDSRVSVLNVTTTNNQGVSKRDIQQGTPTLEMELEISGGNSSEPTSAEIVSTLVNNQYSEFNSQISSSPDAPSGTQVGDAVSKTTVGSHSGDLSPILPPVTPPTNSPISPPITENTPQSNTPVRPTSSGSRLHLGLALTVILHLSLRLVPLHQQ